MNGLQQNNPLQIELLKILPAQHGHFKLESGHHGNLWLDLERFFLNPKAVQPFIIELAHKLSSFKIDAVCGPMTGGAFIAQVIAVELGIDFLYTERIAPQNSDALYSVFYKLPNRLREVVNGKNIAIVDDVINAGSAVRGTMNELEALGAKIVAIGSLLVLGETGRKYFAERNLEIQSIAQLKNEIWIPEECPLCKAERTLDQVG